MPIIPYSALKKRNGIIFLVVIFLTIKHTSMANKNKNRDDQQGRQSNVGNKQKTTQTGGQNQGGQRANQGSDQNQGNDQSRQGDGGNRGKSGNR